MQHCRNLTSDHLIAFGFKNRISRKINTNTSRSFLQKDFLNRIPALRGENYWEKLKILKMISLQRRQERYRIIYIWKILEGLAPNCGIQTTSSEDRRQGRKCKVQNIKTGAKASAKALREQTFQVHGPQLFNCLPSFLRNMTKYNNWTNI